MPKAQTGLSCQGQNPFSVETASDSDLQSWSVELDQHLLLSNTPLSIATTQRSSLEQTQCMENLDSNEAHSLTVPVLAPG